MNIFLLFVIATNLVVTAPVGIYEDDLPTPTIAGSIQLNAPHISLQNRDTAPEIPPTIPRCKIPFLINW